MGGTIFLLKSVNYAGPSVVAKYVRDAAIFAEIIKLARFETNDYLGKGILVAR